MEVASGVYFSEPRIIVIYLIFEVAGLYAEQLGAFKSVSRFYCNKTDTGILLNNAIESEPVISDLKKFIVFTRLYCLVLLANI